MADRIRHGLGHIADTVGDAVKEKLEQLEREKDELKARLEREAREFKAEKIRMIEEFQAEKKQQLSAMLMAKYVSVFEFIMAKLEAELREQLTDDEYMPHFVKRMINALVSAYYPEFRVQVQGKVLEKFASDAEIYHGEAPCCNCSFRAFIRYHNYPYDRNVWRLIRDPVWWILLFLSLCPIFAISQIFYILLFVVIDKKDEYQLTNFITEFKALQFASLGVLSALIGAAQYYYCTTESPSNCDAYAPRVELWIIIVYVAQIVVIWVAFLSIRCAERKGGLFYQYERNAKERAASPGAAALTPPGAGSPGGGGSDSDGDDSLLSFIKRDTTAQLRKAHHETDAQLEQECRGRLMKLLIYDCVYFFFCLGLCLWAAYDHRLDQEATVTDNYDGSGEGNWKFHTTLYWIRTGYGLLAFPFFFLIIPGVSALFSHAKKTGYNPYGRCVPYIGREEQRPVPWDPERKTKEQREQEAKEARRRAAAAARQPDSHAIFVGTFPESEDRKAQKAAAAEARTLYRAPTPQTRQADAQWGRASPPPLSLEPATSTPQQAPMSAQHPPVAPVVSSRRDGPPPQRQHTGTYRPNPSASASPSQPQWQ